MKTFRLIAAGFFFAAIFAVSTFAQTAAAQPGVLKIVVIDTGAFGGDEKGVGGITKYINAQKSLETEFKTVQTDLQTTANRIQTLEGEIQKLQTPVNPNVPISQTNQTSLQAKVEEYQNLQVEFKRKEEDAKNKFARRQQTLMAPIMQDIGRSFDVFAKQKGYGLILDSNKLFNAGVLLFQDDAKVDVTKEFITFYNARPAGTAAATK